VDQALVVEDRFKAGATLLRRLDEVHFSVNDALWLRAQDEDDWRLWLSSTLVDNQGPTAAYTRLRRILRGSQAGDLDLRQVTVVSRNHPLLQLLRSAVRTGPGISNIRFSRNTINGTFIEDAYIYRLQ
jgi:hypothetical protein